MTSPGCQAAPGRPSISVDAADAEIDDVDQRQLLLRRLQWRQRIAGDLAEVTGAADRVGDGAVAGHEPDRLFQPGIVGDVVLDGALPEGTLGLGAAPIGE